MSRLEELKKSILADGVIDAEEVAQLRAELYADGVIDRAEADFLFELNDAVSGKANSAEWQAFFTQAICDYLLKDETSPGEIDADEEAWLLARISADGTVDEAEKALLREIERQAKSMPEALRRLI